MEPALVGLTAIVVLGTTAQWLAWRLHLPSILLLLVFGFVAGPVTGFLDPEQLFGETLFAGVSLAVAVILFEGGLSLKFAEVPRVGRAVLRLITAGVLVTWVIGTAAAYWLLGLSFELSVLLGAIAVVSGPTVIGPLLRYVRPRAKVGSVLKWEGILIDPVGALLTVLVFEAIVAEGPQAATSSVIAGVVLASVAGVLSGLAAAAGMLLLLRRFWVPDYLHGAMSLAFVMLAFTAANGLYPEAGLLAVTLMGIAVANQRFVPIRHIVEFKENLRTLLVAGLFVILAARVQPEALLRFGWRAGAFVAVLMLVARPLAVLVSTRTATWTWRERAFLSWVAPRGIVAAAVSSIFAERLTHAGYAGADALVPLTFLVITVTVTVYSLSARPLARRLDLTEADPQGALIVGANRLARAIGTALRELDIKVLLVDANFSNVSEARMAGLPVLFGNILDEETVDEEIDLAGLGHLLALTPNDEANSLAALSFAEFFGRAEVYQLPNRRAGDLPTVAESRPVSPPHLRGQFLFGPDWTYEHLRELLDDGATVKATSLTPTFPYSAFEELYGDNAVPLFVVSAAGRLLPMTVRDRPTPRPGQVLVSLVKDPEANGGRNRNA